MQSPPPTPEQLQRDEEDRLRQIAAEMQPEIDKLLREEQGEWLASTGRPMPMNLTQLVIEARVAGISRDDIGQADERRESLGYEQVKEEAVARKILRDERIADEIAVRTATATPVAKVSDAPRGRHEQEDDELDARLLASWKAFAHHAERLNERALTEKWVDSLPEIIACENAAKQTKLKTLYLRRLHNTKKRHGDKKRKVAKATRRTK